MYSHQSKSAIKKLKCLAYITKIPLKKFREHIEDTFHVVTLPNNIEKKHYTCNELPCDLLIPELAANNRLIFYIHGGNFIAGSCASWHNMCASLSHEAATRLLMPEYRLAPEYPFPCALEDIYAAYLYVLKKERSVIIAADGSGASLALALLHKIKAEALTLPKAVVLISPWVSMQKDAPLFQKKKNHDLIMSPDNFLHAVELYTYKSNRSNALVSPLEKSLAGFPPLYIQVAEHELLLSDAHEIARKAQEAELACTMDVCTNLWHYFQMTDEYTGEAQKAIARIGSYIQTF